jgi:hypothetical protein
MATSQKSISACIIALDEMNAGLLDVAPAPNLEVWEGSLPSFPEDPDSGSTLLATLPMSATPFGAAYPDSNRATCDAAPITSDPSTAAGTAQYWRIRTNIAAGNVIYQGDVTVDGGGGSLTFDNITFAAGGLAAITTPFKLHLNE